MAYGGHPFGEPEHECNTNIMYKSHILIRICNKYSRYLLMIFIINSVEKPRTIFLPVDSSNANNNVLYFIFELKIHEIVVVMQILETVVLTWLLTLLYCFSIIM